MARKRLWRVCWLEGWCSSTVEQVFITDWGVVHRPAGEQSGARELTASLDTQNETGMTYLGCRACVVPTSR